VPLTRLARFAWAVLIYTIGVILWGAYVRATGSGAGCGSHWPLCNGEVVPRAPTIETLIEYSHRLTSGLALIAVVVLLVWTWRACAAGHPARRGAAWSVFFMLTEAAVGAGLVLFELVADNASMARAIFMAAHLVNTFILVGAITLTAWWLSGAPRVQLAGQGRAALALGAGALALILASMSGAVAALGDTLFPATSLAEALRADLSATSHILIRLRVLHPALAIAAGLLTVAIARRLRPNDRRAGPLRSAVVALVVIQIAGGLVNVLLLAPVWMQIVHLLIADALWIGYILMAASLLAEAQAADPDASRVTTPLAWSS
jgi:heme a synthase